MKKWICMSDECFCRCEVGSKEDSMVPIKCPYISNNDPKWVEMDGTEPVTENKKAEAEKKEG